MNFKTMWIIPAIAAYVGCTGGGTGDCDDVCPPSFSRCTDDVLQQCVADADGCRVWQDTNCASSSMVCEESGTNAVCVTEDTDTACTDDCPAKDETQCDRTKVQTCTEGTDSCLDWVDTTDCGATDQTCDDSAEPAVCVSGLPTLGSEDLATCTDTANANDATLSSVQCPSDALTETFVDWWRLDITEGDCVWVHADNLSSANGADLFAIVMDEGGSYTFLDDEATCAVTQPEAYGCPEGQVTIDTKTVWIGVGQWDGTGCNPGDMDNYQLYTAVNGTETPATLVTDDMKMPVP